MKKLAHEKFEIEKTRYKNGISCKFDNRRVTVAESDDIFYFEFKMIDHDYEPKAICKLVKRKLSVTKINLSREAAEIIMFTLAEMMGLNVCIKKDKE